MEQFIRNISINNEFNEKEIKTFSLNFLKI